MAEGEDLQNWADLGYAENADGLFSTLGLDDSFLNDMGSGIFNAGASADPLGGAPAGGEDVPDDVLFEVPEMASLPSGGLFLDGGAAAAAAAPLPPAAFPGGPGALEDGVAPPKAPAAGYLRHPSDGMAVPMGVGPAAEVPAVAGAQKHAPAVRGGAPVVASGALHGPGGGEAARVGMVPGQYGPGVPLGGPELGGGMGLMGGQQVGMGFVGESPGMLGMSGMAGGYFPRGVAGPMGFVGSQMALQRQMPMGSLPSLMQNPQARGAMALVQGMNMPPQLHGVARSAAALAAGQQRPIVPMDVTAAAVMSAQRAKAPPSMAVVPPQMRDTARAADAAGGAGRQRKRARGEGAARGAAKGPAKGGKGGGASAGGASDVDEFLRAKNREHARNTRLRKKAYLVDLKNEIDALLKEADRRRRQRLAAIVQLSDRQSVRRRVMQTFFYYRAIGETDLLKWQQILDANFTMVMPVTPYRPFRLTEVQVSSFTRKIVGAQGMAEDSASLQLLLESVGTKFGARPKVRFTCGPQSTLLIADIILCRWMMRTEDAVLRGAAAEVMNHGMLKAVYTPQNRLLSVQMHFDVMVFMQHLSCIGVPPLFPDWVVPTTIGSALREIKQPCIFTEAEAPFRILHVNNAWSDICGYTAEEVRGMSPSVLQGKDADNAHVRKAIERLKVARCTSFVVRNYRKDGSAFNNYVRIIPLHNIHSGQCTVTHYIGIIQVVTPDNHVKPDHQAKPDHAPKQRDDAPPPKAPHAPKEQPPRDQRPAPAEQTPRAAAAGRPKALDGAKDAKDAAAREAKVAGGAAAGDGTRGGS